MLRFTIRELVLLTLVVAMGVGWWVQGRSMAARINELTASQRRAEWKLETLKEFAETTPGVSVVDEGDWEIRLVTADTDSQRKLDGGFLEHYLKTGDNPFRIPRHPKPVASPPP